MDPIIKGAIPVPPATDTTESLNWWTNVCGFKEAFRDATPPNYAGINRGEAYLHIAGMSVEELARKVGDPTMVRIAVQGIEPCMTNTRSAVEKCTQMALCRPSPGARKSSGRLTPMACA